MTAMIKNDFLAYKLFTTLRMTLFIYKSSLYFDTNTINHLYNVCNIFTSYTEFNISLFIKSISRSIKSMGKGIIYLNV